MNECNIILLIIHSFLITYTSIYSYNYETFTQKQPLFLKLQENRKTPVLESLFYKVANLQACNSIKKTLLHRCFLVKFAKFFWRKVTREMPPIKFPTRLGFGFESGVIFRGAIFLVPWRTWKTASVYWLLHHCIDFYNSLKYTFFIFTNNFFFIMQLKQ